MKKSQIISGYKKSVYLILIMLLFATMGSVAEPLSNVFTKTIQLGGHPTISYRLYDVSAEVIVTDKQELKIEMEYMVDGKPEEVERLKDMFEKTVIQSDHQEVAEVDLSFQNNFELEIMGMKWSKLIFKSDTKQTIKLKEFKVKRCRIWVPKQSDVDLQSKYSTIDFYEDVYGYCNIDIYDSKVNLNSVSKSLMGEAKYSSLSLGDVAKADVNLYECKFKAGEVRDATIKAKYSSINTNNLQTLNLDMYEGTAGFGNVRRGQISNKYAHITIMEGNELDLSVYEGSLTFDRISRLKLNAKYMELKGDFIDELYLNEAYENEIKLSKVNAVESKDGKYNEFTIGDLCDRFIHSGYEDEIEISALETGFKTLSFQGKYLEITLSMVSPPAYIFKGNVQYPSFSINESDYTIRKKIGDSSKLEFNYEFKSPHESSPEITIEGYEIDFSILN
ncbi:hypothetical protein KDU71_14735 [Carboxylicivirga sediminis]|uniref:Adhesin domain-containing protein n=1 Tax=Carboxylicivirga sediminis TaxID=2006564 RepID=A0A941F6G1_9BACT|nr:hypothetical protein [Carboxylicivirga sediminis]MBR8536828.1 hypothetical protein [Carboxylicivirga sediminis]